jgi:hypothetical protein
VVFLTWSGTVSFKPPKSGKRGHVQQELAEGYENGSASPSFHLSVQEILSV